MNETYDDFTAMWQAWFDSVDQIAREQEKETAGLLALSYAIRAAEAQTVDEAVRLKGLSDYWRQVAREVAGHDG